MEEFLSREKITKTRMMNQLRLIRQKEAVTGQEAQRPQTHHTGIEMMVNQGTTQLEQTNR
jgi:hypothetical protein